MTGILTEKQINAILYALSGQPYSVQLACLKVIEEAFGESLPHEFCQYCGDLVPRGHVKLHGQEQQKRTQ